jgi:hippurate hydrolase
VTRFLTPDRLAGVAADLAAIRHDIHRHPETAFEEVRTAAIAADRLESWGLEVHRGIATTGVVATLRGRRGTGRSIALRADMDALHLDEKNDFDYASVHPHKMHACGHDGHTTMLLGAARQLAADPDFAGTVHFVFQPAEENLGGAAAMVEAGLFERFPCAAIYGTHNMPGYRTGQFAIRPGAMMAAADGWRFVFRGTGGHGAMPDRGTDPTWVAAQFIVALQGIVGRNVPPSEAAVLSAGHIAAGSAGSPNVIPSEVLVAGTTRSFSAATRDLLQRRLHEVASALAQSGGCTAEGEYHRGDPPLVNAEAQTAIAIEAAVRTVGRDNVIGDAAPFGGAEDFSVMLEKKPGAYILLGNGHPDEGPCHDIHSPHYDFNDRILTTGAAYWVNLVQVELGDATGRR